MATSLAGPAFEPLMEHWRGPAYRLAMRYVGDVAEAEDVTQEIFIQLYRQLARYDPARPFGPWFWKLAANVCRNYRRRRFPAPHDLSNDQLRVGSAVEDTELLEALAGLEPGQRAAILLHHHVGLSIGEMSKRLGVSDSAVKSRLHRARASLRRALSESRLARVLEPKFVEQVVAGSRQAAGPGVEAKEGVELGGAHLKMGDDDGPGPLTRASASGGAICQRISVPGH